MRSQSFSAVIGWGPRLETPEQLASRIIDFIDGIRTFDPLLEQWYTVSHDEVFRPLEICGGSLAGQIAARVHKDDDGNPDLRAGYMMPLYNFGEPKWTPRGFRISLWAGSDWSWSGNAANFVTSEGCDPDLSIASPALFKAALLALAEAFDASYGFVSTLALADLYRKERDPPRLGLEWMTYLGPRFAQFADPPPSAIVERRPNGGLLMAATDEVFSTDDPGHMAVARDIQASVAAFNALKKPYPGLELPEA